MNNLTIRTANGIIWSLSEQLLRRSVGIIITILLARFLVPDDFGLIAMMAIFLELASQLMNSGFKEAVIRMKDANDIDFNTVFYSNIALGLISYGVLFVIAPFVSDYYEESRLNELIRVVGLIIIINSFQVVQSAILTRELNFKAQLKATLPASIISGLIAVTMAYFNYGVWAIVTQMVVSAILATTILWAMKIWRPKWLFSYNRLKKMFGFSIYLLITGLSNILFANMYIVIIAKYFSVTLVGYYFFSSKIKQLVIGQLVVSIQAVTYPALSKIQDDPDRLKSGYKKVISITTFLLFPVIALLAALAEPLLKFLFSEQWLPAVIYLQLMCIVAILQPLHAINLNILKVSGRSDLILYLGFLKKFIMVLILIISFNYGVIGILIGQIISSVIAYIPNSYYSDKLINYPLKEQLADFFPGLILSSAIAFITYNINVLINWSDLAKLLVLAPSAIILYLIGAHFLKLNAYLLSKQMILEKIKR
ncbi:MAG: lipopolysaccharide biosynthesis protein [gamma proteobacterium symbiont of Bathyaustriella thionipta]|nr:lipopolysaccharide biosynthesis protein [gamma proteobacterium symbiont of Bathyaustriella thionipta]MCU7949287.1 lipopolysaccharide biosynthesis protein [gamma proteobacterium symbiont of Bathyaustriella thionipta]MCU7953999.1 lipopolysaccharide biosynthesis protein [gamma proteobacterium symbiont of Bathyaustriella thionipta]MCU7955890.1 lipopolysaccharide biosynthesis protein [gamma proteobacterium symbiont of Bathyaustriella thionipta]MCU7966388.1 lipopolysaccharide biosynthesis protein 